MDNEKTVVKSLKNFLSGTMLSRGSGLGREVAMAFVFGVSPGVASFWMAFRFANLFRRLFGEGGLNMAFIPHYESLKKQDPKKAATFYYNLTEALTYFLLALVVVVELVMGGFLLFKSMGAETRSILELSMIMLPSLIFLSLYALNSALLNTQKKFFLPSAAPSFVNLIWIIGLLFLHHFTESKALTFLAMIIVFAFAFQWFVTALPTFSLLKEATPKKGRSKELILFLTPFLLTIVGVTSQQINSAIDTLFAKAADPSGPAILWYALRLQQLPFALIGVGLMNALLPPLSRAEDEIKYLSLLNFSLNKVATFMIPLTIAIVVGSFSAVNLLYGRGAFDDHAIFETSLCLMAYGASLLPMSWTLLLSSAFYAKKEYKIPTLCSLLSIACNIILNAFFVYGLHMGAISIAVATTLSSILNVLLLWSFLGKRHRFGETILFKSLKVLCVAGFSALTTLMGSHFIVKDVTWNYLVGKSYFFPKELFQQLTHFGIVAAIFVSTLLILAHLFKIEDLSLSAIRSRKRSLTD